MEGQPAANHWGETMRRLGIAVTAAAALIPIFVIAGLIALAATHLWSASGARAGVVEPVAQVDPATLTCDGTVTFDDVTGGAAPGTNYDAVFESGGADFAERFAGQTLTANGDFDVLSGSPSNPLALQTGAANQNLNVFDNAGSQVLTGLGPVGFPNSNAIGEGSFAVLFDFDQSEFGFDLVGGNGGTATVDFFGRDGTLIHTIVLTALSDQSYGFQREGGLKDIAGISVQNDDGGGIGFDNLCHDVAGVVGQPPTPTPTPTPTPAPSPAATATPTPTPTPTPTQAPAALPPTGGQPSGGSGSLPWLAFAASALALVSGGGWLAYQRRRVR